LAPSELPQAIPGSTAKQSEAAITRRVAEGFRIDSKHGRLVTRRQE